MIDIPQTAFDILDTLIAEYGDFNKNAPDWIIRLQARNMCQVLGRDLQTPSSFVVCYTPDGREVGGTRWALRLAKKHGIKIYNIGEWGL